MFLTAGKASSSVSFKVLARQCGWLALAPALTLASPADTRPFPNSAGAAVTYSASGGIDRNTEFFRNLGGNGRACVTCHRPESGWSVTPTGIAQRFRRTSGTDPIFRVNDGSNSPNADVSSKASRRIAYSQLLAKGVFRIGLQIPAGAEFELLQANDPYGFVSAGSTTPELSLFRRPLPATNLKFLSAVMWDGRESLTNRSITEDLGHQANSATTGHAQGADLSTERRRHIVGFETALFTAQVYYQDAKSLTGPGVKGGPRSLAGQGFSLGENQPYKDGGGNPLFEQRVFKLFDAWSNRPDKNGTDVRAAIARGQEIFNTRTFEIKGVAGFNDEPRFGNPAVITGTCSTCHNTPNVGSSSATLFLNTGISDESRSTPDLPFYTLRNKKTGEIVTTMDPGRALVTGLWQDVGRFKVPGLRALSARPPYFHDGSAGELGDVVDFYETRFGLGLNNRERLDLISFLGAL